MITIKIIKIRSIVGQEPLPDQRTVSFIIYENSGPIYWYSRGGLPLEGNIQDMLEAEAESLYAGAVANDRLATDGEIALAESREWYIAHPNAIGIFNQSIDDLDTQVHDLVWAIIPTASGADKQGLYLLLMNSILVSRIYVFGEGLLGNGS
jgi:hypothetical protein